MNIFSKYKTFIFDCDGVILQSNTIKTAVFYEIGLEYGKTIAQQLVDYHQKYGGVSRFKKLEYLFKDILKFEKYDKELEVALFKFGNFIEKKLLNSPFVEGIELFLNKIPHTAMKMVISGGLESEIKYVFTKRYLNKKFNYIFGSPDAKIDIAKREKNNIKQPSIFFGDSKYDYECSQEMNSDFVFVYGYSEFKGWKNFFKDKNIRIIKDFKELI